MAKLKTNIREVQKKLNKLERIAKKAAGASVRATAKAVRTEAARIVVKSGYAKVKVSEVKKRVRQRLKTGAKIPLNKQGGKVIVGAGDIPPQFMNLTERQVSTRRGKRWRVVRKGRKVGSEPGLENAFHLKSVGQKKLRQAGGERFDKSSKLFTRQADGSLKQYYFKSFSDIIRDSGQELFLRRYALERFEKEMIRNLDRYTYAVNSGLSVGDYG